MPEVIGRTSILSYGARVSLTFVIPAQAGIHFSYTIPHMRGNFYVYIMAGQRRGTLHRIVEDQAEKTGRMSAIRSFILPVSAAE
jgi:hypothetical protein